MKEFSKISSSGRRKLPKFLKHCLKNLLTKKFTFNLDIYFISYLFKMKISEKHFLSGGFPKKGNLRTEVRLYC